MSGDCEDGPLKMAVAEGVVSFVHVQYPNNEVHQCGIRENQASDGRS